MIDNGDAYMNTKQLYYAVELSKSMNFSQVAERLGISQPALSKQILALEKELDIKLFERTTPLALTSAGEHFIREAQELLYQEDQLLRSMEEYKSGDRGRLVIGISPFRCLYLIPPIVRQVKEKFPEVDITLHEITSDVLRKETAEGKYDFAVVNLPADESVLDVLPIEPDKMVLAVPKAMLSLLPPVDPLELLPQIDLKDCQNLPFITQGPTQEMRRLFDQNCAAAKFHPRICMEVVGVATAWSMAREGLGATLLPLQFVKAMGDHESLVLFTLKHSVRSRQPAVVTRRGQYLSKYAEYAISLLTNNT